MHAKRKDEDSEFEKRSDKVGLLQTDSPQTGNLRLAWRVVATRPRSRDETGFDAVQRGYAAQIYGAKGE
jgi:hypothetical protein